jgi:hypothetical protein
VKTVQTASSRAGNSRNEIEEGRMLQGLIKALADVLVTQQPDLSIFAAVTAGRTR